MNRSTSSEIRLQQNVDKLRGKYLNEVGAILSRLSAGLLSSHENPDSDVTEALVVAVHRISGSAGSYDLHELGTEAAALELLFSEDQQNIDWPDVRLKLKRLIELAGSNPDR